jgi:hypothetical protein
MQINLTRAAVLILVLSLFAGQQAFATVPAPEPLVVSASGEGNLKVWKEKFKFTSVVIKLMEDGNAEITLITYITIFVTATWSGKEGQQVIDLVITGGATKGGVEGSGKLTMKDDRKSISALSLKAVNKLTKRNIELTFTAK